MNPTQSTQQPASGYNRIPVLRQLVADQETPVSSYLKLATGKYSFLLESVEGGAQWGRYSIIGLPASTVLCISGYNVEVRHNHTVTEAFTTQDPLAFVETFRQRYSVPDVPELPMFSGGLVGYFGYDTVRYVEPKLAAGCPPDTLALPDILLMVADELLVFDNLSNTATLVVYVNPAQANALAQGQARLDELTRALRGPSPYLPEIAVTPPANASISESDFESGFTQAGFKAAVNTIKEYVLAGDVMQVVPSQRLSVAFEAEPLNLYRALRRVNPSPYMYFLDLGGFQVVGSSPEILGRCKEGKTVLRPLAGTRKRGRDEAHDKALEAELLADPKEIAEHLMLIDLGRNDIGRVAQTGTVVVSDQMTVERYSHVMHIVSNVEGILKPGLSAIDVLKATLPAGTLSGAPKIRAMEIIDELEPVKRGIYGGAVGYIAWNGNMDTAIAIRTAIIKDGRLTLQAGAGVVADSDPEQEWQETMNKARAIVTAVAMVCGERQEGPDAVNDR